MFASFCAKRRLFGHLQIFDVSSKANFYGKDGVYSIFAGRDATKAFAKNSLDEADLDVTE